MYPLNVELPAGQGFAVANDEAEHAALSDLGYLPPLAASESHPGEQPARDALLQQAELAGLKVDGRWSDKRLADELAKLPTEAPAA